MYIGLLEDEPDLAQHVREILEGAGHTVSTFNNGEDIVKAIGRDTIDLFVLDWRVPRLSGLEVLKHIRQVKSLTEPVLFLTSRSDELDITDALNAGADDYCVKPVRPKEFLARVAALLRRTYRDRNDEESVRSLLDYKFNKVANTVTFQNKTQSLSEKEFKLALFLFENAERAMSRERLTNEVWGNDMQALSRTLDVHIAWIRKKLDLSATSMRLRLRPVHGYGYRLMSVHEGHPDD